MKLAEEGEAEANVGGCQGLHEVVVTSNVP